MPAQLRAGWGSGYGAAGPSGLGATWGRHTASRTWRTLLRPPSLQLKGGCRLVSPTWGGPVPDARSGLGPLSPHPASCEGSLPLLGAGQGWERRRNTHRAAITGCWSLRTGAWETGGRPVGTCRRAHHRPKASTDLGRGEGKKWVTAGNGCGASTQTISHMMGLVRVHCDQTQGQPSFKTKRLQHLQMSVGNGCF